MNKKHHILLLEDDIRLRDDMLEALSMEFHCDVSSYVDEAFAMLSLKKYDMVVTDLMLPGKTGFDFVKTMRQNPDYMDVPILILSALSSFDFIQKGFSYGAVDYMVKPFSLSILIEKIKALLDYRNILQKQDTVTHLKIESKSSNAAFLKVEEIIANSYDNPNLCVKDVAIKMHMTVSSLNRMTKKHSGKTVNKLLIDHRMEVAKMFLENSKLNITEVAYNSGFTTVQYFCALFKKRFNVNPKEYRYSNKISVKPK